MAIYQLVRKRVKVKKDGKVLKKWRTVRAKSRIKGADWFIDYRNKDG